MLRHFTVALVQTLVAGKIGFSALIDVYLVLEPIVVAPGEAAVPAHIIELTVQSLEALYSNDKTNSEPSRIFKSRVGTTLIFAPQSAVLPLRVTYAYSSLVFIDARLPVSQLLFFQHQ